MCSLQEAIIWHSTKAGQPVLRYLGSLPLDLLLRIRIFWHTNGLLLRWERGVRKQLPGLEALLQERLEVLTFKLDGVLNRTQRWFPVGLHAVAECTVQKLPKQVWAAGA